MTKTMPSEWLDATWEKGNDWTLLKWADVNKSIHYSDAPFMPYFFVEEGEHEGKVKNLVNRFRGNVVQGDFISPRRKKLIRIDLPYPSSVRTVRDDLEKLGMITYESMIPYVRRVVWDEKINQCPLPDRCAFDIEVDARKGFPDVKDAKQRIMSVAVVGSDGKEYFFADNDERQIFKDFHYLMKRKYHLMTGWNIRDFDLPYWRARAREIGFKIPFTPIQEIDAMLNYQKASAWGFMGLSYKLDDVADRELGMSKISFRTKAKIEELWSSFSGDKKLLKEYNINDALLVRKLDEKLRLSELYVTLSRFVKLLLRDAVWVSACAEALIMRELQEFSPRICFPRRSLSAAGNLPGGLVMEPLKGLHFSVFHDDFTSLYNRIIQTFNLSPEIFPWFEEEYKEKMGFYPSGLTLKEYVEFVHKKTLEGKTWEPILPKVLRSLEAWRKDMQKQRDKIQDKESMEYIYYQIGQTALKLIILGCWGIIGRQNTAMYNLGLASNITLGGQEIMTETIKIVEELPDWKLKVLYADTDGLFFETMKPEDRDLFKMTIDGPLITAEINKTLREVIERKYDLKGEEYSLDLGTRYVMSRCFFITKKRYIGRCVWEEGKYGSSDKVAGVEMRRSDSFDLLKESQRVVMNIFLEAPEDRIEKKILNYLEGLKKELFSGKYDDKLIITTGTKKKLDQYRSNSPQRRIIEKMLNAGAYRPGDDISWVIAGKTSKGNLKVEPLVPGLERPSIGKEGYKTYWQRIIKLPEKILGYEPEIGVAKLDGWL